MLNKLLKDWVESQVSPETLKSSMQEVVSREPVFVGGCICWVCKQVIRNLQNLRNVIKLFHLFHNLCVKTSKGRKMWTVTVTYEGNCSKRYEQNYKAMQRRWVVLWWTQRERKEEITVRCKKYNRLKWSLLFYTHAFSLLEKFKLQWQHQPCTCQKGSSGTADDLSGRGEHMQNPHV